MDTLAQAVFGEKAEQRRAGPYHLIKGATDFATGEKDFTALIWPVFTFNPVMLTLGQLLFNKKVFTGKQIYHKEDPIGDIGSDIGKYLIGQVPQAPPIMSAVADEGGATKFMAKQLDIKAYTEQELARIERAKKREERAAKSRKTAREKDRYIP